MPDPASHAPIVLEEMDLQLTSRCNLSCGFCSVDANNPRVRGRLARRRVLALLDQAASMGLKELHLTGGEPSLSPDLEAVVRHGSKLGLRTRIITNGTLLDAPRLEALVAAGLGGLMVSVDGLAATHDAMRGAKGTWRQAMATVQHAIELGLRTRVSAVAFQPNLHEIPQLMVLCAQRGVDVFSVFLGSPLGRGIAWADRTVAAPAWRRFLEELSHSVRRGDFGDEMQLIAEQGWAWQPDDGPAPPRGGRGEGCGSLDAGFDYLYVRADGLAYPCVFFLHQGQPLADLSRGSLASALDAARRAHTYRAHTQPPAACAPCRYLAPCAGGCRGYAKLLAGDWYRPDPRCANPERAGIHPLCPIAKINLRTGRLAGSSERALAEE